MDRARARRPTDRVILIIALAAILAGVFARFYALERPLFWQDETTTALRTTGHTASDYARLFDGRVRDRAEVMRFVELDRAKSSLAVARTLAREDPQHVPLYYMLERDWIGVFGTSAVGMRGLSVLCGIVAIGLTFALGRRFARSTDVGLVAASLVAVSPLFVLASRQAREYALFADAILLATYAFVTALENGTTGAWVAYGISVAIGAYADSLFAFAVIGHGVALVRTVGLRSRSFAAFVLAAVAAAACFAPWAYLGSRVRDHVAAEQAWTHTTYPLPQLVEKWAFNFGALVFDGEYASLAFAAFAILGIGLAVGFGLYALRTASGLTRMLPIALALPTVLGLSVLDLATHAHFATVARYLVATWLGFALLIAVGIARALAVRVHRPFALGAWVALLALGIGAAVIRGGSENWWDNGDAIAYQTLARTINARPHPLVLLGDRWNVPLEVGRYLRPDARMLLFKRPPHLPAGESFAVAPPADVLASFRADRPLRATNLSPRTVTPLARFGRGAHGAGPSAAAADAPDSQNALWYFVMPAAKR